MVWTLATRKLPHFHIGAGIFLEQSADTLKSTGFCIVMREGRENPHDPSCRAILRAPISGADKECV